jgi:simple sugar transport system ATP-binding protein
MVFQHFALFETLTVAENIALALDDKVTPAALAPRIRAVSEQYGLPLDPARLVHSMSVGERQRVEIVRCLLQSPKLLIMDEPTSVLTPDAVLKLFESLRRLAAEASASCTSATSSMRSRRCATRPRCCAGACPAPRCRSRKRRRWRN